MLIRGFSFEVKQCPTAKYLWHFSSVLCSRNSLDYILFHHLKRLAAVVLLALIVENMFSALHPSKFPTCCMNWDLFKYPQLLGFHGKEEIKQGKIYFVCLQKQLTIIEQGCEKYSDFSVSHWSIIYRRLRQIVDLRDNVKWRYFGISEFNNCVIIWSLFCLSTQGVVKSLFFSTGTDLAFSPERGFNCAWEGYLWKEYWSKRKTGSSLYCFIF